MTATSKRNYLITTALGAGVLALLTAPAFAQRVPERNPERNAYFGQTHVHTSWDPGMLRSVTRILALHGFATEAFGTAEGFLAAGSTGATCVVLDINLGGVSGIELNRHQNPTGKARVT